MQRRHKPIERSRLALLGGLVATAATTGCSEKRITKDLGGFEMSYRRLSNNWREMCNDQGHCVKYWWDKKKRVFLPNREDEDFDHTFPRQLTVDQAGDPDLATRNELAQDDQGGGSDSDSGETSSGGGHGGHH